MNHNNCPICGFPLFPPQCEVVPYPSRNVSSKVPERIIFCGRCSFGMAEPMPSDEALSQLYNESNFWSKVKPAVSPKKQPLFFALACSRWSLIQSYLDKRNGNPPGLLKLLDVWAGFGYLGVVAGNTPGVTFDEYADRGWISR